MLLQLLSVQELCESRGECPGLPVIKSLMISVDVKQHWTVLRHWSQFVPNMSTDIWGHEALHHHHHHHSASLCFQACTLVTNNWMTNCCHLFAVTQETTVNGSTVTMWFPWQSFSMQTSLTVTERQRTQALQRQDCTHNLKHAIVFHAGCVSP